MASPPQPDQAPASGRWLTRAVLAGVALVGVGAALWALGQLEGVGLGIDGRNGGAAAVALAFAAAAVAGLVLQSRIEQPAARAMGTLAVHVDLLDRRIRAVDLFIVSFLGLFLEVLLIRWHATSLMAAAYFKNVTLLAAFLGLGLGFAAATRQRLSMAAAPIALAFQIAVVAMLDAGGFDAVLKAPADEWRWGLPPAGHAGEAAVFYGFFAGLFISTILIFIPIGQLTGRLMQGFAPIKAYTINILGALAGVIAFGVVSYLWLPPAAWFAAVGVLMLAALRHERIGATAAGAGAVVSIAAVAMIDGGGRINVYSPYQRLEVQRDAVGNDAGERLDSGVLISANKAYHLRAANLGPDFVAAFGERFPRLRQMRAAYEVPYSYTSSPRRVLVVGAGAGNDVAAALRNGAERVDAVEIDPAIWELGRRYHAERPYDDPRVATHIDDARAFMRGAETDAYDLIVFGLLDSHTLLSGMSSVRLDNFVYTLESFEQAKRLLRPGGVMTVSFATGTGGYLTTRLYDMLTSVFGERPRSVKLGYDDGMMFIARQPGGDRAGAVANSAAPSSQPLPEGRGPDLVPVSDAPIPGPDPALREATVERVAGVAPATDDWPFLYLHGPSWNEIPKSYLIMLGILAAISAVWILAGAGRSTGISPHFFFLGGAFLLIETKGITELALIFGTTWIVSSVVIAAILLLILLANLFVTVAPPQNRAVHYAALGACLLAGYFIRLDWLLSLGWWSAAIGATLLLVLPLFFAGVIFATSLRQAVSLPRVFASNLLGAILGGLCEYASMATGFRNLYLLGLALYGLSFVSMPRRRAVAAPAPRQAEPVLPEGIPAEA